MTYNKKFTERIKILVGNEKPTSFGKRCGVDGKTISSALDGKTPGDKVLKKICDSEKVSVEWLLGLSDDGGPNDFRHCLSEPNNEFEYSSRREQKYEKLIWKFEHIFDFLMDFHEGDSIAIHNFMEKMEKEFLFNDPDYRLWLYEKQEEAHKRSKKHIGENNKNGVVDIKSANGC
jgi:hypothetical protein